MSVWDVPRTDQLPAGCSPALLHGTDVQVRRGLMVLPHDDHCGLFTFSLSSRCLHAAWAPGPFRPRPRRGRPQVNK